MVAAATHSAAELQGEHKDAAIPGRHPFMDAGVTRALLDVCVRCWPSQAPAGLERELLAAAEATSKRLARRLQAALREEGLLHNNVCVRFEGQALVVEGGGDLRSGHPKLLPDLASVARFCCGLCAGAEANVQAVLKELQSAFEHECLCLIFRDCIWCPSVGPKPPPWLWAWDRIDTVSGRPMSHEDRLMLWEQLAAFAGHPLHVMAKSRLPLSLEEAAVYAPEFAPTVHLRVLAVHRDLMRVFPSVADWQNLWRERCPAAVQILDTVLSAENADSACSAESAGTGNRVECSSSSQGALGANFVLLPLHPLNLRQVQELYVAEFAAGRMHLLPESGVRIPAQPTLSLRTLSPQSHSGWRGLRLKVPVPLHTTSLPRYVSPVEVCGSMLVGRALRALALPPELVFQAEDFGAHLCFSAGSEAQGNAQPGISADHSHRAYSYEEARFCSAIFRASPAERASEGHCIVPLAGLFARLGGDAEPILWQEFWHQHEVQDGRTWFQKYATSVLRAQLGVFLLYGIAIEAHQQNTLLEFARDGSLRRLVYQELGGGVFWDRERLAALPVDFRGEVYARDDVVEPFEKCLACLRHTLLRSHLLPLAHHVSLFFHLPREALHDDLRKSIERFPSELQQDQHDRLPAAEFENYMSSVVRSLLGPGERKALLRMRLLQTKSEVYVDGVDWHS